MIESQTKMQNILEARRILGLNSGYTPDQLKSAFRNAAKMNHPDILGGSHELFLAIKSAFDLLNEQFIIRDTEAAGEDIEIDVILEWTEFLHGSNRTLDLSTKSLKMTCMSCLGSGEKPSTRMTKCMFCLGTGSTEDQTVLGKTVTKPCSECRGLGKIRIGKCNKCSGTGQTFIEWKYEIDFPPGLFPGNILKFKNRGGPGEPPGSLTVRIKVKPTKDYEVGDDFIKQILPVNFAQYTLGGMIDIKDPYGKNFTCKIPNHRDKSQIEVSEKGVILPNRQNRSSLCIEFKPYIPEKISRRAELLLRDLTQEWEP